MKNILLPLLGAAVVGVTSVNAVTVDLYVDAAPNKFGSPLWNGWWNQAKSDVVAGNFTNLRSGTYPGSTTIDPLDMIVYSTGDLGKRTSWIYWVPDASIQGLTGNFEVKWVIDWAGYDWTLDSNNNWALDAADTGWAQPSSWEGYNGGVIGSFGNAWWATDNDALPFSTDADLYNETDNADIQAFRTMVFGNQTYITGMVRYRESESTPWQYEEIRLNVPETGCTITLLSLGMLGLAGLRRKFSLSNT